jgi:acetylornithine/LysW-gamma-L-lysine aminotransferase
MKEADIFEVEDKRLIRSFFRLPVAIERGEGVYLYDVNGKRYLDLMAGYGVALLGHRHPAILKALMEQAEKLITCHGSLYNDARAAFLEALSRLLPRSLTRYFLTNSGAEAVELALKLARRYTGKPGVISMMGSYHGKTFGALSVTSGRRYREPFQPLLPNVRFVPYGDVGKVEAAIDEDTAAIIVEPIQGEAGVCIPPVDFLPRLRELCTAKGVLLILDEIQTGLGRTGKMFCFEHWGIQPDILCIGKGLAGGLPVGCVAAMEEIADRLRVGEHTSTFSGNPLVSAVGSATIKEIVEGDLPNRAMRMGQLFLTKLKELQAQHIFTREARGMGLMLALECRFDVRKALEDAARSGLLLCHSAPNTLRFLPPLIIDEEHVEAAIRILHDVLARQDQMVSPRRAE